MGAQIEFLKLVVGDRDYRIDWQETTDDEHRPVLEIAEVWAVGARADSEVYDEMMQRMTWCSCEGVRPAEIAGVGRRRRAHSVCTMAIRWRVLSSTV